MLLKNIELVNIGPYEGTNFIELNTYNDKNTILIGGKNGSGKTTFLKSIKLALYGPLSFGFKTTTDKYLSQIEQLLNDQAKFNKHNRNFGIKISFSMVEDFKRTNIEIVRKWIYTETNVKEIVNVFKDNQLLKDIERDIFLSRLRVTFPPSLLELCFFDGEDIASLTSDENLSRYLLDLSEKLFNLDLFNSLKEDLKKYLSETTKSDKELELEKEKDKFELELLEKSKSLEHTILEKNRLFEKLKETKQSYEEIKEQFSTHGGLFFDEREEIKRKILNLEFKRKQVSEQIKEFIALELPFFICLPMVRKLVKQLKEEENYYISNIINEKLNRISFNELKKEFEIDLNKKIEKALLELIKNAFSPTNENTQIIHNASKTESHQVHLLLESLTQARLNKIYDLIDSNEKDLKKLARLNKKLKDQQSISEFDEMILLMEQYSKDISNLESRIVELTELEETLKEELHSINKQLDSINKALHNIYKKKSSFDLTQKIIRVSETFQKKQLRKKVKDIEFFTSKMIRRLLRKNNFIKQIYINPETFDITLIDSENKIINKNTLSAGEQQLLVLSIIWGTIRASKKQIPFVLDTLLGRLDSEHRNSVINELVPKFGKQIIILSTDTEITDNLFMDLSPYISNYYTLNFDNDERRTKIENHFFNLEIKEVHS